MNELEEFRINFLTKLKSECAKNGTSFNEEFVNEVSELLCGSEEIPEDIHYCYYEGVGNVGKRKIQLAGYVYNDFDDCLNLYVIPESNMGDQLEVMTLDEIERCSARCTAFILNAEFIKENAEESHPAYGLAFDIAEKTYHDLKKFQINIITDKLKTKNYKGKAGETIVNIPISYTIIDIERVFQIENSLNGKVALEIDLKDFTGGAGIPCMLANKTEDYQSYLCNIPGIILANLYNAYGSRLLEGNVRSFLQQKNKVNKGIRETILKEPENFFIYNNGITATADEVVYDGKSALTYVKGLQIVNGGQTTASLATCFLNDKKHGAEETIKRISVPMKLTVVPYDKAVNLIPSIARYANSQNKVSEADLWSNHPFHIKMEEISRRLITPIINNKTYGTYWFYERARGQYKQSTYKKSEKEKKRFEKDNPKSQLITKTDFAKYINILTMHPEYACLGGEKSFFKVAPKIKDEWDKNSRFFNDAYFQEVVSIAILYKDVDAIVKKQGRDYKANINAYTVSLLLYLIDKQYNGGHINFKEIWSRQGVAPEIHNQLMILIEFVYDVLTSPNRTVENVTEWAKRETCWNRIKDCNVILDNRLEKFVLLKTEYSDIKRGAEKEDKEISAAQAMMEVYKYGSANWKKLIEWNNEEKCLTEKELNIAKIAIMMDKGKFPSEKQSLVLIKALYRARTNGYLL